MYRRHTPLDTAIFTLCAIAMLMVILDLIATAPTVESCDEYHTPVVHPTTK